MVNQISSKRKMNTLIRNNMPRSVGVLIILILSFMSGFFPNIIIMLCILTIFSLILILRNNILGYIFLFLGSIIVLKEIGTGTNTNINFSIVFLPLLFVLIFSDKLLLKKQFKFRKLPANLPLFILLLTASISLVVGNVYWDPGVTKSVKSIVQLAQLAVIVFSALAFWLGANGLENEKQLKVIVYFVIFLGLMVIINAWLEKLMSVPFIFKTGNALYFLWPTTFSLSIVIFYRKLSRFLRFLFILNMVLWVSYTLIFVKSNVSNWLPILISIGILVFLRSIKTFLVLSSAITLYLTSKYDLVYAFLVRVESASFYRPLLWENVISAGLRSPVFGVGLASYRPYTLVYGSTQGLPPWNEWLQTGVLSHNNYIDIFAQTGIVGLIAFLWLIVSIGVICIIVYLRTDPSQEFRKSYSAAMVASWISITISLWLGDWLIPYVYNVGLSGFRTGFYAWFFWGAIAIWFKDQSKVVDKVEEMVRHGKSDY